MTCGVSSTLSNCSLQSTLGTFRKIVRHELICRGDTLENNCAYMFRMLSEINQCRARAVRAAENIYLVVPQCRADFVEIIHRDWSCVEREVGSRFELLSTLLHIIQGKEVPEITL